MHDHPEHQDHADEGFTLIELLVVIVIVGILAAIAVPVFLRQREKAVDAGVEADLKALATIQETVYTKRQTYLGAGDAASRLADLLDVGWEASEGNVIEAAVQSDRYCLRGHNPSGSRDGAGGGYYWYDSAAGGLASSQPGGACAGVGGFDTVS